jgi:hypothetical protein
MPIEITYAPVQDSVTITFDDLLAALSDAGLIWKTEPEGEDMHWVVFTDHDSALLASVIDRQFVFGTLHASVNEDPSLVERVDAVMTRLGYSGGDEDEFG